MTLLSASMVSMGACGRAVSVIGHGPGALGLQRGWPGWGRGVQGVGVDPWLLGAGSSPFWGCSLTPAPSPLCSPMGRVGSVRCAGLWEGPEVLCQVLQQTEVPLLPAPCPAVCLQTDRRQGHPC